MTTPGQPGSSSGARLLVESLEAQGVEYVFGVPGAKTDKVFDALLDSKIKTVVCRQEQNAAFIAAGIGRITGKAGVVLVTSVPGCSNLGIGLAAATSDGDPVVAIGGTGAGSGKNEGAHQSMDTVNLFRPITKFSAVIDGPGSVPEVIARAFHAAESGRPGAAFVSASMDVLSTETNAEILPPTRPQLLGPADPGAIADAAMWIDKAQRPAILLGLSASEPRTADSVRLLLAKTHLPVVCTHQGAEVVSEEHFQCFGGRVGLFRDQLADHLLAEADLVITVGYCAVECEPSLWNRGRDRVLIHIDRTFPEINKDYRPEVELVGDIASTIQALTVHLEYRNVAVDSTLLRKIGDERKRFASAGAASDTFPVHPMRLVHELQAVLRDDITLCLDMSSFHNWLTRHLYSFRRRQLLFTNGQLTPGVGLPWAIAASLVHPSDKVISISSDDAFLFSAMELEMAVRLKCNLVQLVWIDGAHDMVRLQQMAGYARASGADSLPIDLVQFAESLGAKGFNITSTDQITAVLKAALDMQGPVVIGIPVDYRDNQRLREMVHPEALD